MLTTPPKYTLFPVDLSRANIAPDVGTPEHVCVTFDQTPLLLPVNVNAHAEISSVTIAF